MGEFPHRPIARLRGVNSEKKGGKLPISLQGEQGPPLAVNPLIPNLRKEEGNEFQGNQP